jgi:hypothetical protein
MRGQFTCTEGTCYIDFETREDGAHSAASVVKTEGGTARVIHKTVTSTRDET